MSPLDREYIEKRQFKRMKVDTPVQISLTDDSKISEPLTGMCRDLSGCGILVLLEQEIPIGQELLVTVMSDHGQGATLHARCHVTRTEVGPKDQNILGLEILEVLNQSDDHSR